MFQRVFKLSTGNRLFFTRNPPFGFWSVNYGRGAVPSHLTGMYTTFAKAYQDAEGYLESRGTKIKEEEPWLDPLEM